MAHIIFKFTPNKTSNFLIYLLAHNEEGGFVEFDTHRILKGKKGRRGNNKKTYLSNLWMAKERLGAIVKRQLLHRASKNGKL